MGAVISFVCYFCLGFQFLLWYAEELKQQPYYSLEAALLCVLAFAVLFTYYWPNLPGYVLLVGLCYALFLWYDQQGEVLGRISQETAPLYDTGRNIWTWSKERLQP